jgi:hypothetical protein
VIFEIEINEERHAVQDCFSVFAPSNFNDSRTLRIACATSVQTDDRIPPTASGSMYSISTRLKSLMPLSCAGGSQKTFAIDALYAEYRERVRGAWRKRCSVRTTTRPNTVPCCPTGGRGGSCDG